MTLPIFVSHVSRACLAALAMVAAVGADAAEITGAGATFPYPVYAAWATAYKAETGAAVNYQSIGSGAGVRQIRAGTVDFGATDRPLKAADLAKAGLVQWPQVMGALVAVYNLPGIGAGELVLDGATLAGIYLGKIRHWRDPAIRALNPALDLPDRAIGVVRRSDGAGTTFLFTDYLSRVSAEWRSGPGAGTAVEWPVGVGARGNEGVAANVQQTRYAIGYVEHAIARHARLSYAALRNRAGRIVRPEAASIRSAAAHADWLAEPGFYQILNDQPGADSWPITGASFILMPKRPSDPAAAAEALKFFDWAFAKGGSAAAELDYIPMPDPVLRLIRESWARDIALRKPEQ